MVKPALLESLSALADGRATAADWDRIQAAWSSEPELRAQWEVWALLGDGLRSEDLLRHHPSMQVDLPLRGAQQAKPQPRRLDWLAPLAAAAGMAAVALLVPGLRTADEPAASLALAASARTGSLSGPSFAQTALGHTSGAWPGLPAGNGLREAGLETAPAFDFSTTWSAPPLPAASVPRRP